MYKICFLSCFFLLQIQCTDNDANPPDIDCSGIACTEVFITLNVVVQDGDGVKVPLDDFQVLDRNTGDDITGSYSDAALEMFRLNGSYPLYNDMFVSGRENMKRTLLFAGFINGEEVVKGIYVVEADCCHVSLLTGDEVLLLN